MYKRESRVMQKSMSKAAASVRRSARAVQDGSHTSRMKGSPMFGMSGHRTIQKAEAANVYYTDKTGSICISEADYNRLDTLVRAYNVILEEDVDRRDNASAGKLTDVYAGLANLAAFINHPGNKNLKKQLDFVFVPNQGSRNIRPYLERSFMQVFKQASEEGTDCHNAYADALLAALGTLERRAD